MTKPKKQGTLSRDGLKTTFRQKKSLPTDKWYAAAEDFAFFSPGALYSFLPPGADPLADIMAEAPKEAYIVSQPFPHELFSGMAAPYRDKLFTWNRVLCAVPEEFWLPILLGLSAVRCLGNSPKYDNAKEFYAASVNTLMMADPTSFEPHPLKVTVFGVNTTRDSWVPELLDGKVQMVRHPPQKDIARLGTALIAGDATALMELETDPMAQLTQHYYDTIEQKKGDNVVDSQESKE